MGFVNNANRSPSARFDRPPGIIRLEAGAGGDHAREYQRHVALVPVAEFPHQVTAPAGHIAEVVADGVHAQQGSAGLRRTVARRGFAGRSRPREEQGGGEQPGGTIHSIEVQKSHISSFGIYR